MARIQIPLDALTSRLNFQERFGSLSQGSIGSRFSNLRPISEFLDFKRLSKPGNFGEVQSRVNYNLGHYSSNYAVVFSMLSIYALLTNWVLLFVIFFVVAGTYLIGRLEGRDLEIGTFRATTSQLWTGLLIIAVPLGLFASPIATLLWLIGASGVVILGHAARRNEEEEEGAHSGFWEAGRERIVEEVDSDDTDTQGVGLASSGKSFVSDPLKFTGIDLGERAVGARRSYGYQASDDEGNGSFSSSDDEDEDEEDREQEEEEAYEDERQLALQEREEALVQSALARIRRAQERGKKEVKLNKEELAALERRRRRIAEEEARNDRRRRQEREQRFSVPLSQLAPTSRKRTSARELVEDSDDGLPRHPEPAEVVEEEAGDDRRQALPPMGYFPPPSVSRNRPRSATSASQRPPSRGMEERGPAPPNYPFSSLRHPSDSYGRRTSRSTLPPDDAWPPKSSPASSRTSSISRGRHSMDPFQYQKEGSRAPPAAGAGASSRRPLSGTIDPRRASAVPAAAAAARSGRDSRRPSPEVEASEIASETSDPDTSDDLNNGVQIVDPPRRGRREQIVIEEDPPTPRHGSRGKKSSTNSSPVKRKPVGGGGRKKRK